jgi:Fur family peroxide stress response transcriptional regulator
VTPDEKRARLQRLETLCRQRGLAMTVQRRRILELVLDRKDHPTADQIYESAKKHLPDVSRTTVYRVLNTLVDVGVITKACSWGAATRFDPVTHRHHHLVCVHCEKLIDIEDGSFRHRVELPDVGDLPFKIQSFCIQFFGVCAACRKKLGRRGATAPKTSPPAQGKAARGGKSGPRRKRRKER